MLFCHLPDAKQQGDGFGVEFEWDVPLMEGYQYVVLENVAADQLLMITEGQNRS